MSDTNSKIETTIGYLLHLIWQQGEALGKATDAKTRRSHVETIEGLAASVQTMVYTNNNEISAKLTELLTKYPQPEQDAPEENAPDEEAQEQE
jgi:hypothetical protein